MNRRSVLASVLALAACTGVPTETQVQTTAALVTAGVDAVAASVLATPGLASTTATEINSAVATVNAANQTIQQATTTVPTDAQAIVSAVKIAAPMLLAQLDPKSKSPEAMAANAAMALLPTILAAAGVASASGKPTMDPAQATLILKGYTGK